MSDCEPISFTNACISDNCTQPLATVKLDPTTRAGASCLPRFPREVPDPNSPLFFSNHFAPSE